MFLDRGRARTQNSGDNQKAIKTKKAKSNPFIHIRPTEQWWMGGCN